MMWLVIACMMHGPFFYSLFINYQDSIFCWTFFVSKDNLHIIHQILRFKCDSRLIHMAMCIVCQFALNCDGLRAKCGFLLDMGILPCTFLSPCMCPIAIWMASVKPVPWWRHYLLEKPKYICWSCVFIHGNLSVMINKIFDSFNCIHSKDLVWLYPKVWQCKIF